MTKFVFIYHGGGMPETPEDGARAMAAWQAWYGEMGAKVVDGGAPVGKSWTVQSDKTLVKDGGSNPASGYTVVEAASYDEAAAMAKGCPILDGGGSVEVAERIEMG